MPEKFEARINSDEELLELDHEFRESYSALVERFYLLFESISKYVDDYNKFVEDLKSGFYIEHSIEGLLVDRDGQQLLSEALYLYGVMLFLLERRIGGPVREKMIVCYIRCKGEGALVNVENVIKLCKTTLYVHKQPPHAPSDIGTNTQSRNYLQKRESHLAALEQYFTEIKKARPKGHPEDLFARVSVDPQVLKMIIAKLQSDDIYMLTKAYMSPEHRSTALGTQAGMLFILLYFVPEYLRTKKSLMREVVDKYFNDNWIVPVYMGEWVDLQIEWDVYPAAKVALGNTLDTEHVRELVKTNSKLIRTAQSEVDEYSTTGILTDSFLLDNSNKIVDTLRNANSAIRWLTLHRKTCDRTFYRMIAHETNGSITPAKLVNLMLSTAQLECILKDKLRVLLEKKYETWESCRQRSAERMGELSQYFTGEVALTRVQKDSTLVEWFDRIKSEILSLEYSNPTLAGRRIQKVIRALEEVEQYNDIDTSLQIKQFLADSRELLYRMVRSVGLREEVLSNIDIITDMSYAWELINDYMDILHERVRSEPNAVQLLRTMFLKLASILDAPLVRISQAGSPDTLSVAEYYSGELLRFVCNVLEVIPKTMFDVLVRLTKLQTNQLESLPLKLDTPDLAKLAQMDLRFELAKHTNWVSTFAQGVFAMQTTLLGVLEVNPRKILEDGIRKELVERITNAMDECIQSISVDYKSRKSASTRRLSAVDKVSPAIREKTTVGKKLGELGAILDGFKRSFEYIQDYIGINGLKVWQVEYSRIINYYVQQEEYRFLKKKVCAIDSRFQSKAIPIPIRFSSEDGSSFMGALADAICRMTTPGESIYVPEWAGWFELDGKQIAGAGFFSKLNRSVGIQGLSGLDRLFGFRIVQSLRNITRIYNKIGGEDGTDILLLHQVAGELSSASMLPKRSMLISATKQLVKSQKLTGYNNLLDMIVKVGRAQLVRERICHELGFSAQVHANLLHSTLLTCNKVFVANLTHQKSDTPLPEESSKLAQLLERSGLGSPFDKVYITSTPCERLPELLLLVLSAVFPRLEYDHSFATLTPSIKSRSYKDKDTLADGAPLALGVATLLKQFHPDYTNVFLECIAKFIRSSLVQAFVTGTSGKAPDPTGSEAFHAMIFLQLFCKYKGIDKETLYHYVPSYLFDHLTNTSS
eukprot:CAMPEP_0203756166 /NCGR_PEP_ID=MMETSP0098-20131031/9484_1 /ASSEMBLY_ACC=CAM_ASM_000208 /TAXON_ID=96639 /ORGANISM=" , Strain NY0313808BC1" /LENGTH=1157 /DNA_ID=CAMNT_0050647929 /DNA_START=208 /DNA_END=3681 /DNA_ORIENTATION=-